LRTTLKEISNHDTNNWKNNSTKWGAKEVIKHVDVNPAEERTHLRTTLKEISNHDTNNRKNNSTITSISSNINMNTKNYGSTVCSTPHAGSKEEIKGSSIECYSPIQDDSMEVEQSGTGFQELTLLPQAHTSNKVKNETKKPSPPVPTVQKLSSTQKAPAQLEKQMPIRSEPCGNMKKSSEGLDKDCVTKEGSRIGAIPSTSKEKSTTGKNKSREWDSGVDTSDIHSSSSKEGLIVFSEVVT